MRASSLTVVQSGGGEWELSFPNSVTEKWAEVCRLNGNSGLR